MPPSVLLLAALMLPLPVAAQAQPAASGEPKTRIQLNFLNPCRPSSAEAEEMSRALAQVRERPRFIQDFEISRGVTTLTEAETRALGEHSAGGPSSWVRILHEFPDKAPLRDAQYSLSVDAGATDESLALHLRGSREVLEILISDEVTGSAAQVVATDTPPDRIRVERYGKSSLVLARCAGIDQSAYAPIFQTAGDILEQYRAAMAVRSIVPAELARLPRSRESGPKEAGGRGAKAAGARR